MEAGGLFRIYKSSFLSLRSNFIYVFCNSLCYSPDSVRMIKSIRLSWASYAARIEGMIPFKLLTGIRTGRGLLRKLCLDGRTTLEKILKKKMSI